MIRLIAAIDRQRGLAKDGVLPWYIPDDIKRFADQTKSHGGNVLLGKATFESFKHGPLAGRHNYVLTHDTTPITGVTLVHNLDQFLKSFKDKDLWVVGGEQVFAEIIDRGFADELYITHVDADFRCDQFFPAYEDKFTLAEQSESHEQNGFRFGYARYVRTG